MKFRTMIKLGGLAFTTYRAWRNVRVGARRAVKHQAKRVAKMM